MVFREEVNGWYIQRGCTRVVCRQRGCKDGIHSADAHYTIHGRSVASFPLWSLLYLSLYLSGITTVCIFLYISGIHGLYISRITMVCISGITMVCRHVSAVMELSWSCHDRAVTMLPFPSRQLQVSPSLSHALIRPRNTHPHPLT